MAHILIQVENTLLPTKCSEKLYYDLSNNGNYHIIRLILHYHTIYHHIIMIIIITIDNNNGNYVNIHPTIRLNNLLQEIVIADHIRTLQTIYRDNQDELNLGGEYRNQKIKLTTKHLMDKIIEGRSRIIALCRLSYGDDSIETLKSEIDLSNAYALQGMWLQVNDHLNKVFNKIKNIDIIQKNKYQNKLKKGKRSALLIEAIFNSLRLHVINNNGQVTINLIDEISNSIDPIILEYSHDIDFSDGINEKLQLLSNLTEYLNNFGNNNNNNNNQKK